MRELKMRNLPGIIIATLCLVVITPQAHAFDWPKIGTTAKPTPKEKLVLMPLRVSAENKNMQGAMETALVQGLQQKYEVFSGEKVTLKVNEVFKKESLKKDCDETRCMVDIALAFNTDLVATANVTKITGGYLLALSIKDVVSDKAVYSNSVPCKNCDAFQVVEKLKELSGSTAPASAQAASPAPSKAEAPVAASGKAADPETAFWEAVQKGNSAEDYEAYLAKYPKGKYVELAVSRINKAKEQEAAKTAQQGQSAWDKANKTATEASYQSYLQAYPQGQYATLATARIAKLKKEQTDEEAKQKREQASEAAKQKREAALEAKGGGNPRSIAFLAGEWKCGMGNDRSQNFRQTVSGNQVVTLNTGSRHYSEIAIAELVGDNLTLSGKSTTNPEFGSFVKLIKVLSDSALHFYQVSSQGQTYPLDLNCNKVSK